MRRALMLLLLAGCAPQEPVAEPSRPRSKVWSDTPTPEEFFGFRMGTDRKLARWDRIVEYLRLLADSTDGLCLDLGTSTQGKPFVMQVFGSRPLIMAAAKDPPNRFAYMARELASPATDEAAARALAAEAEVVVLFTCNLHSSEIASSQTAVELAYELATTKLPKGVLVLLMPSINPDGQEMIVDWYEKQRGTAYEGVPMPWLYHPYAGHDNNRDFYFLNLVESRLVSKVYYNTFLPQVIVDHHQMGPTGARMFVPPYDDPVSPTLDPLLTRWLNVFGTHAALDMQAAGLRGVTHQDTYSSYWIGGAMRTPWWHNRIGILTETASVRIATPVTVDAGEGSDRKVRVVTPDPWPGGRWTLRDIIDYQLECSRSIIRTAARHKEEILMDGWRMARRAIEAGRAAGEEVHVHGEDRGALRELARILDGLGVEFRFDAAGIHAPLARPQARILLELFGRQDYPKGDKPYDVTAWTLSWLLGLEHEYRKVACGASAAPPPAPDLDPRDTTTAIRVNEMLRAGTPVYRAKDGTFATAPAAGGWKLRAPRTGLYKPWTASMDEGWTRLVLERFGFNPVSIDNARMKEGRLRGDFDCIILPDLGVDSIVDGRGDRAGPEVLPPEYQGGIGTAGVAALRSFVEGGGTLVCFDSASDFAIEKLGLPVRNTLKGDKDFSCPGSILKVRLERAEPLTFGMPDEVRIFFTDSPAFQTSLPTRADFDRRVVLRYDEKESPLASGFLNDPSKLQGRSAMVEAAMGKGRAVLFGFRPQHRAQTWGTYKLLFNAIFHSAAVAP